MTEPPRTADADLRSLERLAATGDAAAAVRLVAVRWRTDPTAALDTALAAIFDRQLRLHGFITLTPSEVAYAVLEALDTTLRADQPSGPRPGFGWARGERARGKAIVFVVLAVADGARVTLGIGHAPARGYRSPGAAWQTELGPRALSWMKLRAWAARVVPGVAIPLDLGADRVRAPAPVFRAWAKQRLT